MPFTLLYSQHSANSFRIIYASYWLYLHYSANLIKMTSTYLLWLRQNLHCPTLRKLSGSCQSFVAVEVIYKMKCLGSSNILKIFGKYNILPWTYSITIIWVHSEDKQTNIYLIHTHSTQIRVPDETDFIKETKQDEKCIDLCS